MVRQSQIIVCSLAVAVDDLFDDIESSSVAVAHEDYFFDSGPFETWSIDYSLKRHNGVAAASRNGTRSRMPSVWNEPGNMEG